MIKIEAEEHRLSVIDLFENPYDWIPKSAWQEMLKEIEAMETHIPLEVDFGGDPKLTAAITVKPTKRKPKKAIGASTDALLHYMDLYTTRIILARGTHPRGESGDETTIEICAKKNDIDPEYLISDPYDWIPSDLGRETAESLIYSGKTVIKVIFDRNGVFEATATIVPNNKSITIGDDQYPWDLVMQMDPATMKVQYTTSIGDDTRREMKKEDVDEADIREAAEIWGLSEESRMALADRNAKRPFCNKSELYVWIQDAFDNIYRDEEEEQWWKMRKLFSNE
jgi:hypothetical protein